MICSYTVDCAFVSLGLGRMMIANITITIFGTLSIGSEDALNECKPTAPRSQGSCLVLRSRRNTQTGMADLLQVRMHILILSCGMAKMGFQALALVPGQGRASTDSS